MTISSLILFFVGLVAFAIRDALSFVMAPKAPLAANEIMLYRQFRYSTVLAADKRNQVLNIVSKSDPEDTVRVRIWQALAASSGEELTLKQLGAMVGERRTGELRNHLQHVKKQSQTLQNKKREWKERRGIPTTSDTKRIDKLRIQIRRGQKNELYIRLA